MNSKLVRLLTILLAISIASNLFLLSQLTKQTLATPEGISRIAAKNRLNQDNKVHGNNSSKLTVANDDSINNRQNSHPQNESSPRENDEANMLAAKAEQLFLVHQFISAIELLEQLHELDEHNSRLLNERWQAAAKQWLNQGKYSVFSNFITAYQNRFPHQQAWQLLKIEWLNAINKPARALQTYYLLISNAFDRQKEDLWRYQAHQLFARHSSVLKNQKAWQHLINFTTPLLAHEFSYPPYQLALAQAYIYLDEIPTAINYLDNVKDTSGYATQINDLNRLINSFSNAEQGIELTAVDEHFVVDVMLNQRHQTSLLIDTGASITVISTELYQRLIRSDQISVKRELSINTAGGNQQAFSIIIEQFGLGDKVLYDFEVVVMDLTSLDSADGLLGMNFLKHFQFEIDQQHALLFLSPR
ncbi:retropepsin-like aspartic protease family protein [Thalassotalea sp. ND16A]|uniref:retropepsin-like aspartic protease family protein n=1 Tax=Thalassotalea sp. ND16A TaxID=1535422 RepID=UPI00051A873A|nr:retropepsin-like aspartic protease [Thalassotalea sp. ND16A]KGJ95813.1 hypothetical protein ND16A_1348 [Thalassotalea sp. ND16A]